MQEHETRRFTEEEQVEVIQLAARLQRDHAGTMSGKDLMRVAAEAGIDPTFVLRAIEMREQETVPTQEPKLWEPEEIADSVVEIPRAVKGLIPVLLMAQCMWLFTGFTYYAPLRWILFGVMATLTVAITARLWRTPRKRRISAAIIAGTLIGPALFASFHRLYIGLMGSGWAVLLLQVAVVQAIATAIGWVVGAALEGSPRKVSGGVTRTIV